MIPNAADTRAAIGDFAAGVSNRSLLFEKMVLPKSWGHPGGEFKEANRYNVLRAADKGPEFIRNSLGRNATDHQSEIANSLTTVRIDSNESLRAGSTADFLSLIARSYGERSKTFVASLGGRLLINMAGGVQENAGIALDRCFGLPLIPGSAIKGVARHTALWEIRSCEDPSEKQRFLTLALLIFGYVGDDLKPHAKHTNWHWAAGDQQTLTASLSALPSRKDFKGIVSFLPASPADGNVRIVAEGITPHTDDHGKEKDPTVLTFPAVERGSSFGFALVLNRRCEKAAAVLGQAASWVKSAITGTGIGAKTAAGFGWFVIDEAAEARLREQAEKEAALAAKKAEQARDEAERNATEKALRDSMTALERHIMDIGAMGDDDFAAKAKQAAAGAIHGDECIAFFQVLQSDGKKERRKQWRKKKPDLWAQLTAAAVKAGITLS